jgi:hypothetical protein
LPRKKCKTPAPHPKILSTTVPKLDPAASQLAHDLSTNLLPAARMTDSAKSKRCYLNASLNLHAGLRNYHQNLIADSCTDLSAIVKNKYSVNENVSNVPVRSLRGIKIIQNIFKERCFSSSGENIAT